MTELDRLIRKEVALGTVREPQTREDFIGNTLAPLHEVEADEVTFQYLRDSGATGLAPARAEDAEAELYMQDDFGGVEGRASILDWALKNRYSASQVQRYRDDKLLLENLQNAPAVNGINSLQTSTQKFSGMLVRDSLERRRRLDQRIEWMQVTPLVEGKLAYNDGKISFDVDYGRPTDQTRQAPASGLWDFDTNPDFDVVADLLQVQEAHYDKYGVELTRGIASKKVLNQWYRSTKFRQLGLFNVGQVPDNNGIDLNYVGGGVSPQAAINYVQEQTGITFQTYDASIRTRALGSTTSVNTRFMPESDVVLLPDLDQLSDIDGTEIGFGKTLTSPHPEGNWTPGFYEWEDETRDPWQYVRGTGIKAFPVYPYLQYTHTLKVKA